MEKVFSVEFMVLYDNQPVTDKVIVFAEDELHAMYKVGDIVSVQEFGEVSLVSNGTGGHTETNLNSYWEVA